MDYSTASLLVQRFDRQQKPRPLTRTRQFQEPPPACYVAHREGEYAACLWALEAMTGHQAVVKPGAPAVFRYDDAPAAASTNGGTAKATKPTPNDAELIVARLTGARK